MSRHDHRRRARRAVLCLVILCGLLAAPGAASATNAGPAGQLSPAAQARSARAAADNFVPNRGVVFNDPLSGPRSTAIMSTILDAVRHAPRGSRVRIATFNFSSAKAADVLIAAHRRGVGVGVVSWRSDPGDRSFPRMRRVFRNQTRNSNKSFAMRCRASCRGRSGTAHSKVALFSQTGAARNVVMLGTGNMTGIAQHHQWNDLYVKVGDRRLYRWHVGIFGEMRQDRPRKNAYRSIRTSVANSYYPFYGAGARVDPTMKVLNGIRCAGANGGTGTRGHTVVKIAMASWQFDRGLRAAHRVKELWRHGCRIRIIYTQMGDRIAAALAGIPRREIYLARGVFGTYLHMKAILVNGHWGGDRSVRRVWDGSGNLTDVALRSDENNWTLFNRSSYDKYARRIDGLWKDRRFPFRHRDMTTARREVTAAFWARPVRAALPDGVTSPYDLIQVD